MMVMIQTIEQVNIPHLAAVVIPRRVELIVQISDISPFKSYCRFLRCPTSTRTHGP